MDIHIGVTGTRSGMNDRQTDFIINFLNEISAKTDKSLLYFHHGDCIGVDIEAAGIARGVDFTIIGHPPIKTELRGFFDDDETRTPKGYFARNRDIVDDSSLMLVVPWQNEWSNNGGTWYTHDYAKKQNKDFLIVWPDKEAETFYRE